MEKSTLKGKDLHYGDLNEDSVLFLECICKSNRYGIWKGLGHRRDRESEMIACIVAMDLIEFPERSSVRLLCVEPELG